MLKKVRGISWIEHVPIYHGKFGLKLMEKTLKSPRYLTETSPLPLLCGVFLQDLSISFSSMLGLFVL